MEGGIHMNAVKIQILIIVTALLLWACGEESSPPQRKASPPSAEDQPTDDGEGTDETTKDGSDPEQTLQDSRTVILGDSVWALSGDLQKFLELHTKRKMRSYAVNGARITGTSKSSIPNQYKNAKAEGPIKTILMDGGGNDLLVAGLDKCAPFTPACQEVIDDVEATALKLLADAADNDISHVVYLGYYKPTGFASILGEASVKGNQMIQSRCESETSITCIFVDPVDAFSGQAGLILSDGIHPTKEGSKVLASLIWEAIQKHEVPLD